ncbi:MAG: enolase C-terminal domain-like protein [Mycobacteriales bacterium]
MIADEAVTGVAVAVFDVPTDAPEADGTLAWSKTSVVVVEVRVGDGPRGLGWSYTGRAAATLIEDLLAGVVVGRPALDVPGSSAAMVRAVRNLGRPGITATAISAVDLALWDLKARLLDLPLCRLLGQVHTDVPVYGSGGFTSYDNEQTTAQLTRWVHELGIPRVKIKIGESWGTEEARDLERVALARRVIGPDVELYVDANGGYTVGQAVRVARRFEEYDVRWFEEPVSSDDLAGLAAVRHQVVADVAAGEYGYDLPYFARMIGAGAVDCLQVDVTRCGGVTEFLRAAAVAAAANVSVSAHCAPSLHAHPATAVPNLRHLEYFHDHERIERLLFDGALVATRGSLTPDTGRPGIGMELKRADAEPYRVH